MASIVITSISHTSIVVGVVVTISLCPVDIYTSLVGVCTGVGDGVIGPACSTLVLRIALRTPQVIKVFSINTKIGDFRDNQF